MRKDDTDGKAPSALVVVDMVHPYDFPDADAVAQHAPEAVANIARLLDRARGDGVQVIYVDDDHGDGTRSSTRRRWSTCSRPRGSDAWC